MRKSGERGEVMGDEDDVLTEDNRLRPAEGLSICTRVALPMFAMIVPLLDMILFGRLSSSPSTGLPNVAGDVGEGGCKRVGSANGLPFVSVPSSISFALNAIRASGDREDAV